MISAAIERRVRRAVLLGRQRASRPPEERSARLDLIRRHLSLVTENDRLALLAEFAIGSGRPETMIKAASLLLGGVAVIGSHLPSIFRVVFAQSINKQAEQLAFLPECDKTLH
jgi:hypothetical protein